MLVGRSRAAWRSGQGAGQGAVPGGPSGVRLSHLIPRSAVNFSARKVRTALGVSDECSSLGIEYRPDTCLWNEDAYKKPDQTVQKSFFSSA